MSNPHSFPLTRAPHRVLAFTGQHVSYRQVYGLVLDGKIPAEQISGRYFLEESTVPQIAAALGLNPVRGAA